MSNLWSRAGQSKNGPAWTRISAAYDAGFFSEEEATNPHLPETPEAKAWESGKEQARVNLSYVAVGV